MADARTATTAPPNRCDVDPRPESSSNTEPTLLTVFAAPMEAHAMIQRTADYARDPKAYLQRTLGPETFLARQDLLSIPEKVDKDGYGSGKHKTAFEAHIAKLMGKPHGLFFLTGVQAQLSALKIHCDRKGNSRVAWHATAHLDEAEESSYRELYGLERRLVGGRRDALPTVEEIKDVLALPEAEKPAVLLVEIPNRTLGCATYTFGELEAISQACKAADVMLHCDGARLWEIEPYYASTAGKTFTDICALFDTVYVSFYKGLAGGPGAMLLCPSESFKADAKMWQRRAGGNAFTLMYEVVESERGFNENIGTFERKFEKMQEVVGAIKAATEEFRGPDEQPIVRFMTESPTCCQGRVLFQGYTAAELNAARDAVQKSMNVTIFRGLWPKMTLDEKMAGDRKKVAEADGAKYEKEQEKQPEDDRNHAIEWMMMSVTEKIPTETFAKAYVAFCEALLNLEKEVPEK